MTEKYRLKSQNRKNVKNVLQAVQSDLVLENMINKKIKTKDWSVNSLLS